MQAAATKKMTDLETIKGAIAAKMDSAAFTSWISPLQFNITDGVLALVAQNQFSADFISGAYGALLTSVADEFGLAVKISVRNTSVATSVANDNATQTSSPAPVARDNVADFDEFVASDENAFVLSACKKLASGQVAFSPLFIYGASGCGK